MTVLSDTPIPERPWKFGAVVPIFLDIEGRALVFWIMLFSFWMALLLLPQALTGQNAIVYSESVRLAESTMLAGDYEAATLQFEEIHSSGGFFSGRMRGPQQLAQWLLGMKTRPFFT